MTSDTSATIRRILSEQGKIAVGELGNEASLYEAGLTSFSAVQVMFALEAEFGIEFPERMLNRRTFSTIASMAASVEELRGAVQAA